MVQLGSLTQSPRELPNSEVSTKVRGNRTGAPRSPKRTWAENDGRSPSTALSESPKSPLGGHRALKAHTSTPAKGKQTTAWGFRRLQRTFFGEITRLISSEPSFRTHPARIPDHSAYARQSRTTAAEPNPGGPPGKAQAWPECRDHAVAGQTTRWWSRR
jgi:hypothetical protein